MKTYKKYKNELILAVVFIVLFILFSFVSKHFFSLTNVVGLFAQMVELGLITLGIAATMFSGGLDLSLGALTGLCTVFLSVFIGRMLLPEGVALLFTLALSMILGCINGYLIGYLKVQSMLATLGTQTLFRGIGSVISEGETIRIPNTQFFLPGRAKLFGIIPLQLFILAMAAVLAILLLNKMAIGRRIFLIGSNRVVAQFAGINIEKNIFIAYVFSAVMGFAASIVITSKISAGRYDVADALLLKGVSAAIFGGVSTSGGRGHITGALCGVAVIALISNGLDMVNASSYMQQVVIGVLLIVVLAFRTIRKD